MNINKAIERIWYSDWEKKGGQLLFQNHDAIIGQVPEHKLHLIDEARELMLNESIAPSGKKFTVPVESMAGKRWGTGMLDWPVSLEQIYSHEKQWLQKQGINS